MEKDLVDKLLKSPYDVRDKALASFQRWDVDSIELTNTKGQLHFRQIERRMVSRRGKEESQVGCGQRDPGCNGEARQRMDGQTCSASSYGLDKPAIR